MPVNKRTTKKLGRIRKIALAAVLSLATVFSMPAFVPNMEAQARTYDGTEDPFVSLTLTFTADGSTFRIYRVADFSETGTYTLTGNFAQFASQVGELTAKTSED